MSGCFICRIRKKKCDRLGLTGNCGDCLRLNIECIGDPGEHVPPHLKSEQAKQVIKKHTRRAANRTGPPLRLTDHITMAARTAVPTLPIYGADPTVLIPRAENHSDVNLTTNPDAPPGVPQTRYYSPGERASPSASSLTNTGSANAESAFPPWAISAAATPALPRAPVTYPAPPELPSPWHLPSASYYDLRAQDEFPGNSPNPLFEHHLPGPTSRSPPSVAHCGAAQRIHGPCDGGPLSAGPSTALTAHNPSAVGNGSGLSMDQLLQTLNDLGPASSFPSPLASFSIQGADSSFDTDQNHYSAHVFLPTAPQTELDEHPPMEESMPHLPVRPDRHDEIDERYS